MKNYIILPALLFYHVTISAQNLMMADNFNHGVTYYEGFDKKIGSLTQLPPTIIFNVNQFFRICFGELQPGLAFSQGQQVDLKAFFKKHKDTYRRSAMIPKYDLDFIFRDTSIGINSYTVNLKLDEYGQIISINWPREGFDKRKNLKSREGIYNNALQYARKKNYGLTGVKSKLEFNQRLETLCWVFFFPEETGTSEKYQAVEFDWRTGDKVEEYEFVPNPTVNSGK